MLENKIYICYCDFAFMQRIRPIFVNTTDMLDKFKKSIIEDVLLKNQIIKIIWQTISINNVTSGVVILRMKHCIDGIFYDTYTTDRLAYWIRGICIESGECNGFGSRLKFWSMYPLMAISSIFIGSIFAKRSLGYIDTLYGFGAKSNP